MCENLPYRYTDFVPVMMGVLFDPSDRVRVSIIPVDGLIQNHLLRRDEAIATLQQHHSTPNLYFSAASFNEAGFGKADCLSSRAFCVDLDYGRIGHAKDSFFATIDDAYACLMTAPVQPTCVWATGHGLQAMYVLNEPFRLDADGCDAYESVSRKLSALVRSDATFTPEHLFRVPLTWNQKPDIPMAAGQLFHWNPSNQYRVADLQPLCDTYGVPDAPVSVPATVSEALVVEYADLPEGLRDQIEDQHEDRSSAMFGIILQMVGAGYADQVIVEALQHGDDFRAKYQGRLEQEVQRCIEKIRNQPHVYADVQAPLLPSTVTQEVALADCAPLTTQMDTMLDRYAGVASTTLSETVRQSSRFHEHLIGHSQRGVVETPCGYGKSTWALCRMALHVSTAERYLYVVDTIEALYQAASILEQLNPNLTVGRLHGYSAQKCHELTGRPYTWHQCNRTDPRSVCRTCAQHPRCAYYNHDREQQQDVVLMCHNGFIRLLEEESAESLTSRHY
jgi:hypothetical protein